MSNASLTTLKEERDRYVAFAFASADAFFELDEKASVKYVGGAAQWLVQKKPNDILGHSLLELLRHKDKAMLKASLIDVMARGRIGPFMLTFETSTGGFGKQVEAYCTCLPNQPDTIYLAVRAAKPKGKTTQLSVDQLDVESGLANKKAFTNLVKDLAMNAQSMDENLDLTFLDVNGLDTLRDKLGDEAAEEFIEQIAAHMRAASVDGMTAGRLDDGKFGIVHEKGTSIDHVKENLMQQAPGEISLQSTTVDLDTDLSEEDMGKALVYAINKFTTATGRFTIDNLDSGYQEMLADSRQKLKAFKNILSKGTFDIMLQPIVHLETLEVHHYEALVRFHELGEGVSPYEYITFAEEAGLIHEFDLAMVKKVIQKVQKGNDQGANMILAVNLSGKSVQNKQFVEDLIKEISGLDAIRHQLLFELTESSQIQDLESVNEVLNRLRSLGHHVCLDDFGAGAAGFQYLKALEIDTVKIDGVYIRDGLKDKNSKALLQSMAQLCKDINVSTIGEWVETKEQLDFLKEIGIGYGQGYLFGKPRASTVGKKVTLR